MTARLLVTAALPYANGSLHIGHLVEYCQADIYVRAMRRLGRNVVYICANDAHGTPIELNARRLGITPEELVDRYHHEHQRDFGIFGVEFDYFGLTHSTSNREIVEMVYNRLRAAGDIDEREVDGNYCPHDQRFLPDRFIRGECPKCGEPEQYGDVCERCGATYSPTDLGAPKCVLCGGAPEVRPSTHLFFTLSDDDKTAFLRDWVDSGALQPDVANYVRGWIDAGLRDWCISRDGPYFGFEIPDRPGKYFYVWLDAPFGYCASLSEWASRHDLDFERTWQAKDARIEHFIGKDIVYFHTLFWPAVLRSAKLALPSQVHVHGMLTVNGEKMSKSRGTFIRASVFAAHVPPEALRYYYACKYGAHTDDLDLSVSDFVARVNSELVNKHANLFSRAGQFLLRKLDGKLGDLPFEATAATADDPNNPDPPDGNNDTSQGSRVEVSASSSLLTLARDVVRRARRIEKLYATREFGQVVRELNTIADIGNELIQAREPWNELKRDPETARETCTFALNVCHALAMYLWPIVPGFAVAGAAILDCKLTNMDHKSLFAQRNRPIGEMQRLFDRIDEAALMAMIDESKIDTPKTEPAQTVAVPDTKDTKEAKDTGQVTQDDHDTPEYLSFDNFKKVALVVGKVVAAEPIPKSKKLLKLRVDTGDVEPRQIVAGIAQEFSADELPGQSVVVVANLAPAKLFGVRSEGMVLAAGPKGALSLIRPAGDLPPGTVVS